jgi:hypothetical protein
MLGFLLFVVLVSCAATAHKPIIEDRDGGVPPEQIDPSISGD